MNARKFFATSNAQLLELGKSAHESGDAVTFNEVHAEATLRSRKNPKGQAAKVFEYLSSLGSATPPVEPIIIAPKAKGAAPVAATSLTAHDIAQLVRQHGLDTTAVIVAITSSI